MVAVSITVVPAAKLATQMGVAPPEARRVRENPVALVAEERSRAVTCGNGKALHRPAGLHVHPEAISTWRLR